MRKNEETGREMKKLHEQLKDHETTIKGGSSY
jgi:hypothetical protein